MRSCSATPRRALGEVATAVAVRRQALQASPDKNRDAADSLASMLRLGGHEVSVAYDGREALALAETFWPEVALLDIGMPRMNGYETAHALRARQHSSLTLFALTGWGRPDDKRRSRAAGFDHHFVKPLDPAEFERILAERAWPLASETIPQRGEAAL